MINIEEIEKRWLRVGELLDVAGKSIEDVYIDNLNSGGPR